MACNANNAESEISHISQLSHRYAFLPADWANLMNGYDDINPAQHCCLSGRPLYRAHETSAGRAFKLRIVCHVAAETGARSRFPLKISRTPAASPLKHARQRLVDMKTRITITNEYPQKASIGTKGRFS